MWGSGQFHGHCQHFVHVDPCLTTTEVVDPLILTTSATLTVASRRPKWSKYTKFSCPTKVVIPPLSMGLLPYGKYGNPKLIPCNGKNPTCFRTIHLGSKVENAGCAEFKQPCEVIDRALLTCHCQTSRCNEGLGPTPGCNCAEKSIDCYVCDNENQCTTPKVQRPCPGIKPACALLQILESKKIIKRYCTEFQEDCKVDDKGRYCQCEGNLCNEGVPASCKCGDTGPGGNPPPSPGGNPPTTNSAGIGALCPLLGIATALIVAVIQDYHFFLRSTFPN